MDRWLSGPKHAPAKRKPRRFESDLILQLPLELHVPSYYLYGMRSQFVIDTNQSDLTVVRDRKRVRYSLNDGDTILTISTGDETMVEDLSVSKYKNAHVQVTITIELDDVEYRNIQP